MPDSIVKYFYACRETWRKETERKRIELGLDNVVVKQENIKQEQVKQEDSRQNYVEQERTKREPGTSVNTRRETVIEREERNDKHRGDRQQEGKRTFTISHECQPEQPKETDKDAPRRGEPEKEKSDAGKPVNKDRVMREIAEIESRLGKRRLQEIEEGRPRAPPKKRTKGGNQPEGKKAEEERRVDNDMEEGEYPESDEEEERAKQPPPPTAPAASSPVKAAVGPSRPKESSRREVPEVEDSLARKQREREEKKQRWTRRHEEPMAKQSSSGELVLVKWSRSQNLEAAPAPPKKGYKTKLANF